jgi:hypothetical protein
MRRDRRIRALVVATTAVLAGCQGGNARRVERPADRAQGYVAGRPSYEAAPSRELLVGSYAGYNYGGGRPRPSPFAPSSTTGE